MICLRITEKPSAADLTAIPPGEALNYIKAIAKGLQERQEIGAHSVFNAICKNIEEHSKLNGKRHWLRELRSKPVPPRAGVEAGQSEGAKEEEELPRGIHMGKSGKPVFTRMLESDVDELPDIAFRIQCVLPESAVMLVYGPSGTGKTFFGYHMAQCLAHNMYWFGRRVAGCKVLYVYAEGRLGTQASSKGLVLAPPENIIRQPHIYPHAHTDPFTARDAYRYAQRNDCNRRKA